MADEAVSNNIHKKEKTKKFALKKNHGLAALDLQYKNKATLAQGVFLATALTDKKENQIFLIY
jgi:hypothetical protein